MHTAKTIEIVDRGRGPQLSTCRITVQDVVPYLQRRCTYDEIRAAMPILSDDEIRAVQRYVQDHYDAVTEQDRRIRDRAVARRQPPEIEASERQHRLDRLQAARQEAGDPSSEPHSDRAAR